MITVTPQPATNVTVLPGGTTAITFASPQAITVTVAAAVIFATGGSSGPPLAPPYNPGGIYVLPDIPANPSATKVFINGVKQVYGIDYTVVGAVLTWSSPNLDLSANDIFEVYQ